MLDNIIYKDKIELLNLLEEKALRARENKIQLLYPDEGFLRRGLYPKHIAFMSAGKNHRERLFLSANRVGKTEGVGLYELTLHLTGDYPPWWGGRRFDKAIKAWAAGDTKQTVREILQDKFLGKPGEWGTGILPKKYIHNKPVRAGGSIADAVEIVYVKHKSGGVSQVTFKSYDQKREAFQGTEQDFILLDEEPPENIYIECLLRTMTNNGMLMLTFTPLRGLSDVVLHFLPGGEVLENKSGKFVTMASWDDVPHLSEEVKNELYSAIPPFQRDSRSRGIPQLGSGAIYPVPESDILVDDFSIPDFWPKVFGMDVGWNRTACLWMAIDPETHIQYLYSEYYRGQAEPVIHTEAIKSRGAWIPGVIDPAARGRGQKDGDQLLQTYLNLGLDLEPAINTVEAGIYNTWQALSVGKLKVFNSLSNWRQEFRQYSRDEKGAVVKKNDHLMDVMRYLVMSGSDRAKTELRVQTIQNSQNMGWLS